MCSLTSSLMAIAAQITSLAGLAGFCKAGILEPGGSICSSCGNMDDGRDDMDVRNGCDGGAPLLDVAPDNFDGGGIGGDGADELDLLAGCGGGRRREPPPPEVLPEGGGRGVGAAGAPDGAERDGSRGGAGAAGRAKLVRNGMVPAMLWSGWMRREREEWLFCQEATQVAAN
ncbi:hypothetical protein BWQ96_05301 [Gracilariopsis chorda]|uniref:Uncharacterized protein n=1 Tax=Gracilariopsis chorda TaxID=448386 RepID=A0A2V3IT74_9FLOR|nr:hypothetical protein BWQ96_05301 [Gracilariopsis chorda]|eukprot:PXF44937.1 hypothetical protein BWQ96_05301 [Gracilariopsis chorda]